MRSICVFAGSGTGRLPEYASAAAGLGRALAERGSRWYTAAAAPGLWAR